MALGGHLAGVEFVPEVVQGVGFAVGVRGDRGAHRGEQVGPVEPGGGEFGGQPGDFGRERQVVGECGVQVPPEVREYGHLGGESGDHVPRGLVACGDLFEVDAGMRVRVGHGHHLRFYGLLSQLTRPDKRRVDFRCGGCRGEQESEDEGDDRVPRAEPHVAVGDEHENPEDDDQGNGHGHAASLLSGAVAN